MKYIPQAVLILCVCFSLSVVAQEGTATVITQQVNLRGTPSSQGEVITRLHRAELLTVYAVEGSWYLVQSDKYAGWVHGNYIELTTDFEARAEEIWRNDPPVAKTPQPLPAGTRIDEEKTVLSRTYVGSNVEPVLEITNDATVAMTLNIGGVDYLFKSKETKTISLHSGIYQFKASAPGILPYESKERVDKGFKYFWRFYVVTRRY